MKKIGFIGCGEWARKKYVPFLKEIGSEFSVVGASNIIHDEEKSSISSQLSEIVFFEQMEEMIDVTKPDGLIITLPHSLHYSAIKKSLEANIPCLVDKPLCPTSAEAAELIEIAAQKNISIAVSSQRRAQSGNQALKSLISSKKIGVPMWIEGRFIINSYPGWQNSWRNVPALSGNAHLSQGLILDTGYHLIDTLMYLVDYEMPKSVYAVADKRFFEVDVDASVILNFNQFRATFNFSRGLNVGENIETLSVMGSRGYASSEVIEKDGEKQAKFRFKSSEEVIEQNIELNFPLAPLKDFLSHIKGNTLPEIWVAKNSLNSLKVIDAIYSSIGSGTIVTLGQ